ncbi:hypothetical protein D3C75_917940 [compost metagenome]
MGQGKGERRHTKERDPDHRLAPDTVTHRASGEGAQGHGREEHEQVQLAVLHAQAEMLDQVEGEVVGERGDVDELGEHQHGDNRHRTPHGTTRQAGGLLAGEGLEPGLAVAHGPAGHPQQHEYCQRSCQHEPGDGRLAVGYDDGSGQQRAEGRAGVATDLEGRLRGAEAPTGGHPGHSRGFGVEGR